MKAFTSARLSIAVLVLVLSGSALPGAATQAGGKPAAARSRDVIVILNDQRPDLPAVRGARAARAAALAAAQVPIVAHLQAAGAARIHGFSLINAVSATVSSAEAEALAAHPLVRSVVPVTTIKLPHLANEAAVRSGASPSGSANSGSGVSSGGAGGGAAFNGALCTTLEPEALQLTNTAFLDPGRPQAQQVIDGNGQKVTGNGVKVAWIADGIDPSVAGFTHTDGTPVFIDYQDFSGDPAGTPTAGGEAFLDASSLAAQDTPNGKPLLFDISRFVDLAVRPLPSPCNIRIRGMAPGASLVGLKVFSQIGSTTNTALVQAIEWAVVHDDVDVINESFGANFLPDNDNDPMSLANRAAVAGGVTVVAGTGDAGPNGTMGAPSTDPWVISAGATTQMRLYVQTGYGAAHFATGGWLSNNISALSSGGFSQSGARTPDVVAGGDLGWALCSTNMALFTDCENNNLAATPIQSSGGTSEASPLTAGEAALIIQAYRSTHYGADPSPALVKQIIMSTATDLGAPPSEQGAGLINSLAAVNAALSVADQNGRPAASGSSLLNAPASASLTDQPNTPETASFAITNTGSVAQHLQPTLQALGPAIAGATLTLTLNPATLPIFPSQAGKPRAYLLQQFNVPAGAQHLDVAIAWQAPFFAAPVLVPFGLIDPYGRNAAYSLPQGDSSGYGHVDVVNPAPGTWTAVIWTSLISATYTGPVQFSWAAERYLTFGSVSPASLDLAPGATQWITARFSMPAQPGDSGAAIRFGSAGSSSATHAEIPISLRTLIPTGPEGGSFSGTLTGGNGRPTTGPAQVFAFDVPPGLNNMSLTLQISDVLYLLEGVLVDPNGMQLSVQPDVDVNGNPVGAMELDRANPQPGRWRFILLLDYFTSGNQTTLPFTAQVNFDKAQVTVGAPGLPDYPHTSLSASGAPLIVPITITNTSGLTEAYFADARLRGSTTLQFGTAPACTLNSGGPLLTQLPFACFSTVLPTEVRSAQFLAEANARLTMDANGYTGYLGPVLGETFAPDVTARPVWPNTVAASITEPEVPWGTWALWPTLVGPFGAAGAPPTPVRTAVFAELKPFDPSVSADSGDLWSDVTFGTRTFTTGLVLAPGATGTIHVTFTPNPALIGRTVQGDIYIDTFNGVVQTGDEVVAIPYRYIVVP